MPRDKENSSGATKRVRPKARNTVGIQGAVLKAALAQYRCCVSTVYGFPDTEQSDTLALQAWGKANTIKGVSLSMTENDLQLVGIMFVTLTAADATLV